MAQSKWAENVGGILGGIFGNDGAANEIAAIGGLKTGGTTAVNTVPVSTSGTGGNGIIYIGLAIVAIFVLIMVFKK